VSVPRRRPPGPGLRSRGVSTEFVSTNTPEEGADGHERPREFNQSLERGLAIISTFGADAPQQTVSELAAKTGLTRATARRFLITLVELGYVGTDGRTFWLTPRVLGLGYSFLSGLGFPDVALPHLESLVAEVDEASEASILDGEDIVYVNRVPGTKLMTIGISVGSRMPAHATSMGKVLLAALPEDQLERYLRTATFKRFLPRTVTDSRVLREQLQQVRREGFAIVDQELEQGLLAVAVPIHDRNGQVIAAINLSTHVARHTAESMRELVPPLQQTARAIERDLAGVASHAVAVHRSR
jgi:IclR family transcriptional regulator, pca regulon regulatory protein